MPRNIVKTYRHLYEKNNYMRVHRTIPTEHSTPWSETVKAFGVGIPEFDKHYICVKMQRHTPEFFAVTNLIRRNGQVHAEVSIDGPYITNLKPPRKKAHLAHEWIHVILEFCGRGFGNHWVTQMREVKTLIDLLVEHTKNCEKLSDFEREMHEALRILLVSDEALQKMLLRVSANAGSSIATLAELRSFTDSDPYEANKTITSLLIQEFVEEWDIEEDIVASRLQEVLGLC